MTPGQEVRGTVPGGGCPRGGVRMIMRRGDSVGVVCNSGVHSLQGGVLGGGLLDSSGGSGVGVGKV